MTDVDDKLKDAALQEASDLSKQIQEFGLGADKYFAVATTITVAAMTLGITGKLPAALIALPFAIAGLLMYVVQLFTERAARVGMRRYLEQYLREQHGHWFSTRENCLDVAVNHERRPSVKISTALYAAGYLGMCWLAVSAAMGMTSDHFWRYALPCAVGAGLAIMAVAMGSAYRELTRADDVAYAYMLSVYEKTAAGQGVPAQAAAD